MKSRLRRTWSAWPCIVMLGLMILAVAPSGGLANHAHFLNYSSVVNGHIYYDDRMDRYHGALRYADDQWSALGIVNIRKTPKNKNPTLRVIDYALSDGLCGGWEPGPNPDRLQVNRRTIEGGACGSNAPRTVLLHEMGHALAIYDHDGSSYWYDVMYRYMVRYDQYGNRWECPLNLQSHDVHDYNTRW